MDNNYLVINNKLIKESEASISIYDRGLRFGDGLFETMRVHNRKIYQWQKHIARLKEGLAYLGIKFDIYPLEKYCYELIGKNQLEYGLIKLFITGGNSSSGYLRTADSKSNFFIETQIRPIRGLNIEKACLSSFIKSNNIYVHFKLLHNINAVLVKKEAVDSGHFDAIQLTDKKLSVNLVQAISFGIKMVSYIPPQLIVIL